MLHESRETVIKLFNDYSSIASEAKHKTIHGKGIPGMSACIACGKVSDHSNLKILSPKQMLQRLPIALAQVKAEVWKLTKCNKTTHILFVSRKRNYEKSI